MIRSRSRLALPVTSSDHVMGDLSAPLVIVEYGSYCSSDCTAVFSAISILQKKLPGKIAFVYRHYPMVATYPSAFLAAEATEAACHHGKFWPMHEHLVSHPQAYSVSQLAEIAFRLGMNSEWMAQELMGHTYLERVKEHYYSGVQSGVHGVPSLFVNGGFVGHSINESTLLSIAGRV